MGCGATLPAEGSTRWEIRSQTLLNLCLLCWSLAQGWRNIYFSLNFKQLWNDEILSFEAEYFDEVFHFFLSPTKIGGYVIIMTLTAKVLPSVEDTINCWKWLPLNVFKAFSCFENFRIYCMVHVSVCLHLMILWMPIIPPLRCSVFIFLDWLFFKLSTHSSKSNPTDVLFLSIFYVQSLLQKLLFSCPSCLD